MYSRSGVLLLIFLAAPSVHAAHGCPASTLPTVQWEQLRRHDFALESAADVQRAAIALIPCLDDPDPTLRDQLAFEALTEWMRSKRVTTQTAYTILQVLTARLTLPDADGFGRPFAALVLAELARMDRIERYLDDARYAQLVQDGSAYLTSVRDYRGFDEREGWRHGVAHGADLLMQLALNPRTSKKQLDTMLAAIASQVAPQSAHFYVYGESDRLVRALLFIAQRHLHSRIEWSSWLADVSSPPPEWRDVMNSQAGLARRHNVRAFLLSLQGSLQFDADDATRALLLQGVHDALSAVP